MGAETHQQVTVTGESLNLASRLMEAAETETILPLPWQIFALPFSKR